MFQQNKAFPQSVLCPLKNYAYKIKSNFFQQFLIQTCFLKPDVLDASQKEQFTPSLNYSTESPNSNVFHAFVDTQNGVCKLNEIEKSQETTEESPKEERPGRNSNPSRLRDRQS